MNFFDPDNDLADACISSETTLCKYCKTRPIAQRYDAHTCGDIDCQKEYRKDYARQPAVKARDAARARARRADPVTGDQIRKTERKRRQTPEYKAKRNETARNKPKTAEFRAKAAARTRKYRSNPVNKAKAADTRKKRQSCPIWKAKEAEKRRAKYRNDPLYNAKCRKAARERGALYSSDSGGPAAKWDAQGRQCPYGGTGFDGNDYRYVGRYLATDHLVPRELLRQIGITDRSIVNATENLNVTSRKKNGDKSDTPFHVWLDSIGAPAPVVDMGRQWYESVVGIIVAKQRAIDPTYELTEDRRKILGLTA